MSVSLLIISHEEVATALVNTVKTTFANQLPLAVATVELQPEADPEVLIPKLMKVVSALDQGDGVLILTDLYGSTPSNIAQVLQKEHHTRIVTGLNLPMLFKVMNYPNLNLEQLAEKAFQGGQHGIRECENKPKEDEDNG